VASQETALVLKKKKEEKEMKKSGRKKEKEREVYVLWPVRGTQRNTECCKNRIQASETKRCLRMDNSRQDKKKRGVRNREVGKNKVSKVERPRS